MNAWIRWRSGWRKIELSCPQYSAMEIAGESVRLKFNYVERGVVAMGEKLTGLV